MSIKAFKLLFRSSDLICIGDKYAKSVGPQPLEARSEFFCINPLHPKHDYRALDPRVAKELKIDFNTPARADLNVVRFQNFMFEMDDTSLATQLEYIRSSGFPFATVTFSGGKSYHAILSLEVPLSAKAHAVEGVEEYKKIWKQLAYVFCSRLNQPLTLLDSSTQNPSRLSRMPGAIRPNGNLQELVQLGALCSPEELNSILSEAPEAKPARKGFQHEQSNISEDDMKLMLSTSLYKQLRYPNLWASGKSTGNYQNLLRLTLWLIDESGASEKAITSFLEKNTLPLLVETGYPLDKCYKAIKDALKMKGRLS